MASNEDLRQRRFVLNNGNGEIPALGFGTLVSDRKETRNATEAAIEVGFRHLDCAERYRNEDEVGAALKELLADGTVRREDLFVTTKLWNNNHRPERVKPALQASLNRLGLDAVDLYLVHTPFAFKPGDDQDPRDPHGAVVYDDEVTLEETWTAMETVADEGLCRAIGLSDIDVEGTRRIVDTARIKPAVVEVESHPYHPQWELHDYCSTKASSCWHLLPSGMQWSRDCSRTRHRHDRSALWKESRAGASGLGYSARHRSSDVICKARAHKRELRCHRASRERNARDQRALETRYRFNSVVDAGEPGFIEVPQGS